MASTISRRTHRKRTSALRLSSDTTATLPEYITVGAAWHREDNLSDRPPDYPDSAEEADEDTDPENDPSSTYVPQPPLTAALSPPSPRRLRKQGSHRRKKSQAVLPPPSPTDPYLDSLLARSVHALEMSNTLLQSSMATQSSLSNLFAVDSPVDPVVETRARGLSIRLQHAESTSATWAEELDQISKGVDQLFEDEPRGGIKINPRAGQSSNMETSISQSLPITSPITRITARRGRTPSVLDLRNTTVPSTPPSSTRGLVTSSATHLPLDESSMDLHGLPSSPRLTNRPVEPSTPAYNMLASFMTTKSASPTPLFHRAFLPIRRHSITTSPPGRRQGHSPSHLRRSADNIRTMDGASSTSSVTPRQILTSLPHRTMTPPSEESSSSDGCPAKLTVLSLRKILDEQPAPPPPPVLRAPAFLPRTSPSISEAGTSTTTASISRLYTKAKHSSSTRAPSPPRHSALRQSSPALSPSPSTSTIPDLFGAGVGAIRAWSSGGSGRSISAPGSGRSTPKRISFAQLPESYAGTKADGSSAKFREMQRKKSRKRGRTAGKGKDKDVSSDSDVGWWSGWLLGAGAMLKQDERAEDRRTRNWGGRMGGAGFEDWAV